MPGIPWTCSSLVQLASIEDLFVALLGEAPAGASRTVVS